MISFVRSRKILRETLTTPGQDPQSINNFMHYMVRRNHVVRQSSYINALVLIAGIVLLGIGFMQLPNSLIYGQIVIINNNEHQTFLNLTAVISLIIICSPLLGLAIGGNIAFYLSNVFIDAIASEFFHVSSLTRQEFARIRLKFMLNASLPLIIFLEIVTLVATITGQILPASIVGLIYIVAIICIRLLLGRKILKTINNLQPIEQTSWAYLQPRIAAWSRLAGVSFGEVLIQPDIIGTNIRVIGRKNTMLIIGDQILRHTDWRQQDAMICLELALVRKKVLNWNFWRIISMLVGLGLLFVPLIVQLSINILDITIFFLCTFLMLLITIFVNRGFRKKMHTLYQDADCISCYFTGDPMATMVALTTIQALNGVQATQKSNAIPSANTRLQQLDQLARQSWPRAPYASELVPAITPVTFGPYQLSTAFDKQSEPAPVPDAPYVLLA
ncbi:hypothetical protein [Dictyobacter formicarum]|nr:hypothetical protein [Dictyobacter formicarum]